MTKKSSKSKMTDQTALSYGFGKTTLGKILVGPAITGSYPCLAGTESEVMTTRRHSFNSDSARRALCVAGIVGFVALALCSDTNVLTRFHIMNTAKAEDNLIGAFHARLGDEGSMPDLNGTIGWLNSAPLNRKSLRGKVVLVNFWTYTCINSLRPLPYVKIWATKYKDAGSVLNVR